MMSIGSEATAHSMSTILCRRKICGQWRWWNPLVVVKGLLERKREIPEDVCKSSWSLHNLLPMHLQTYFFPLLLLISKLMENLLSGFFV
jgi:hypothetical protein